MFSSRIRLSSPVSMIFGAAGLNIEVLRAVVVDFLMLSRDVGLTKMIVERSLTKPRLHKNGTSGRLLNISAVV